MHDPKRTAFPGDEGFQVSPGFDTNIGIRLVEWLIDWLVDCLNHSFIYSFNWLHDWFGSFFHLSSRGFIHSFIHSFINRLIAWLTYSFFYRVMDILIHSFSHRLIAWLTSSFIYRLIAWLIHSFIYRVDILFFIFDISRRKLPASRRHSRQNALRVDIVKKTCTIRRKDRSITASRSFDPCSWTGWGNDDVLKPDGVAAGGQIYFGQIPIGQISSIHIGYRICIWKWVENV